MVRKSSYPAVSDFDQVRKAAAESSAAQAALLPVALNLLRPLARFDSKTFWECFDQLEPELTHRQQWLAFRYAADAAGDASKAVTEIVRRADLQGFHSSDLTDWPLVLCDAVLRELSRSTTGDPRLAVVEVRGGRAAEQSVMYTPVTATCRAAGHISIVREGEKADHGKPTLPDPQGCHRHVAV